MSTVANWPTFMSRLTERHEVAENTMAFQFEKPAGWTFKPGQFVDITLLNPPETDAEGNTRGFSISSAPHEPNHGDDPLARHCFQTSSKEHAAPIGSQNRRSVWESDPAQ